MYVHVSELSEFNKQEPIPMQPRFYTGVYREIYFAISEAWRPDNSISDILTYLYRAFSLTCWCLGNQHGRRGVM